MAQKEQKESAQKHLDSLRSDGSRLINTKAGAFALPKDINYSESRLPSVLQDLKSLPDRTRYITIDPQVNSLFGTSTGAFSQMVFRFSGFESTMDLYNSWIKCPFTLTHAGSTYGRLGPSGVLGLIKSLKYQNEKKVELNKIDDFQKISGRIVRAINQHPNSKLSYMLGMGSQSQRNVASGTERDLYLPLHFFLEMVTKDAVIFDKQNDAITLTIQFDTANVLAFETDGTVTSWQINQPQCRVRETRYSSDEFASIIRSQYPIRNPVSHFNLSEHAVGANSTSLTVRVLPENRHLTGILVFHHLDSLDALNENSKLTDAQGANLSTIDVRFKNASLYSEDVIDCTAANELYQHFMYFMGHDFDQMFVKEYPSLNQNTFEPTLTDSADNLCLYAFSFERTRDGRFHFKGSGLDTAGSKELSLNLVYSANSGAAKTLGLVLRSSYDWVYTSSGLSVDKLESDAGF